MIQAQQLYRNFGPIRAVQGVSFDLRPGEVLGFLGPNAAGKSTTLRMITGFLTPSSGTALIGGFDITTQTLAARKLMGYLPENAPSYPDMTVREFLDFIAAIRGFRGKEKARRVGETMERCFLQEVAHQGIDTLSKGYRQRVCFAQSILHDPPYLIMDEPTDGLDPNQKHEVRQMIRIMAEHKAILLSTHILEEMEAVCTRAVIIAGGRIVADDTPEGLKRRSREHGAVRFRTSSPPEPELLEQVRQLDSVREVRQEQDPSGRPFWRILPKASSRSPAREVLEIMFQRGCLPEEFQVEEGRLDEVFRRITTQALA